MDANAGTNKQIAQQALEAFMARDVTRLREILTPDAVLHQCGFLQPIPASMIWNGDFPRRGPIEERRIQLEQIIAEGDLVALHWRTTGRYSAPGTPDLDGTEVSFPSMSFIRFEVGKIAEIWNIQDTATMHSQLHASHDAAGKE